MGWDTIKDIMNSFLGALVILIGLILIPEIRAKKIYLISVVVIVLLMIWLGIDKITRDNHKDDLAIRKDSIYSHKVDTLNINVNSLSDSIVIINNKTFQFLHRLDSTFQITRDPSTNQPIKNIFNTHFEKARDVYIGTKN